jgi:hypothetical protein
LGGFFAARIEAYLVSLWQRAGSSIPDGRPMRYIRWLPSA